MEEQLLLFKEVGDEDTSPKFLKHGWDLVWSEAYATGSRNTVKIK